MAVSSVTGTTGRTSARSAIRWAATWNQKDAQVFTAFGYSSRQAPAYCAGPSKATAPLPKYGVNNHIGIACKLSRGAIGGPLIIKYDTAKKLGYVNGVASPVVTADGKRYIRAASRSAWPADWRGLPVVDLGSYPRALQVEQRA